MDKECTALCYAINRIPGIVTVESCCGHGKRNFRVWFKVSDLKELPILLYFCDPCHVGFRWNCSVKTDCGMSPVTFLLQSEGVGDMSYGEAKIIADCITAFLKGRKDDTR